MSNVLRIALVDPNDATREALKKVLLGMDTVWLEAECSRYEFFSDVIAQTHPDIGLVVIDANPDKALDLVASLGEASPECAVLVVSSSTDGNLILRAMRAGAKEFLAQPLRIEDLAGALSRIGERRFGRRDGKARGSQVIAVAGATGGVGTTSIAVNLGCALAAKDTNNVALVDLDLCLGDADVQLDAIPEYTLLDVAQNVTRLDFSLLKRSLTKHSSGLYLLPRPVQLEDAALITQEDIQRVIGLLKASFTHVVLDLSKSYNPVDLIALEMASHILLVIQLDLPCLRNVVRLMASFKEMGNLADKVKILVNRAGLEQGQITLKKAEETIGRQIYWQLPNDYRTMIEVRNNGVPLILQAPKAGITHAIVALADALHGDEESIETVGATKSGIGRLLSLWPNK
ncbi:MAG TPA: pilus assembly protein CpaE [Planctomycetaceae bacterium]|nr:pilus assembly protein CpaE [Planctomycetaceae bacterium]